MTGIGFGMVAIAWIIAALLFSRWLQQRFVSPTLKIVSWTIIFPLLVVAPLADELLGKQQFEQLCRDNLAIQVDRVKAVGRTVYFVPQAPTEVKGTWIRIVLKPQRFVDVGTGETIVSYNELMADGGLLVRALRLSEGNVPLTFKGSCVPADRPASAQTFLPLGITYVEPPATKSEGSK